MAALWERKASQFLPDQRKDAIELTMLLMFEEKTNKEERKEEIEENPIFVSKFIAERIKDGTLTPEEKYPLGIT